MSLLEFCGRVWYSWQLNNSHNFFYDLCQVLTTCIAFAFSPVIGKAHNLYKMNFLIYENVPFAYFHKSYLLHCVVVAMQNILGADIICFHSKNPNNAKEIYFLMTAQ